MSIFTRLDSRVPGFRRVWLAAMALALLAPVQPALAEDPPASLTALLDRAMIEDLLVDYYAQLGAGRHDFGAFFAEDGMIDVNGAVAQGQKAIEELYRKAAEANPPKPGTFRMLLSNIRIVVKGDTATADAVWTGINNPTVNEAPVFVEQGREHDQLVKRNGRWYFKHRVITSDGGLDPNSYFAKTYRKR